MESTLIKFAEDNGIFRAFERGPWYDRTNRVMVIYRALAEECCKIDRDPASHQLDKADRYGWAPLTDDAKAIIAEVRDEMEEIDEWLEVMDWAYTEMGIDESHMSSADYMKALNCAY